jgi:hypothetical protein
MIVDIEIWQTAFLLHHQYGANAWIECAACAEQFEDDGDSAGAALWQRIGEAIHWLQAPGPVHGEAVH